MGLEKLGYTEKWFEFKILNNEILEDQLEELKSGADQDLEHFRYYTFINWLESKKKVSNKDIHNYITLAKEDTDQQMAGSAVRALFTAPILSEEQYDLVKENLVEFGDWTTKLIQREDLTRRLKNERLTFDLYLVCLKYKKQFNDNRPLVTIIELTENVEILQDFETNGAGKRMRTLAAKKMSKLNREKQK